MAQKVKNIRAVRRATRTRLRIKRDTNLPRVSVHRSLNQIYAQLIDDSQGKTLTSFSSQKMAKSKGQGKKDIAKSVGVELAKRAKQQGIEQVVLDRGQYKYHGRVAALADGLRAGGLIL